jgi:hypothetical protein
MGNLLNVAAELKIDSPMEGFVPEVKWIVRIRKNTASL